MELALTHHANTRMRQQNLTREDVAMVVGSPTAVYDGETAIEYDGSIMIQFSYDPEADAVYISFGEPEGRVRPKELDRRRHVDYDDAGALVGIEFLFVSKGMDLDGVPEAERVRDLLRSLNTLPFLRESATRRTA